MPFKTKAEFVQKKDKLNTKSFYGKLKKQKILETKNTKKNT